MTSPEPVRWGILGAAGIAESSFLPALADAGGGRPVVIGARDGSRAERWASDHGVVRGAEGYTAVVEDPDVDAVYVPLPNGLHAEWTIAALDAGKHVLCEKPLTSNADEARKVAEKATETGLTVMEAFHYRYHPLIARVLELLHAGTVGAIRRIETELCFPLPLFKDIRYRLDLAGGATMDAGCYAIHFLRVLGGAEPTVVEARAKLRSPQVDRY